MQNSDISLGGILQAMRNIEDATSMSLFQYTKRTTIMSRVFIEKTLVGEDVLVPLMSNIMNIYTGLILTAMNMNQYVQGSKRVRDAMAIVATESLVQPISLQAKLDEYFLGSNARTMLSPQSAQLLGGTEDISDVPTATIAGMSKGESKDLDAEKISLPSGRIINIDFGNKDPSGNVTSVKVTMFLQLHPNFIPSDVASQFVEMNFSPSIRQRWLQYSAGEISFFKDFLLGQDQRRRRFKALRDDKSGALREMIDNQENSLSNAWLKLSQISPEKQNIANTILIFEKNNFDKACSRSGLRFNNFNDRQSFFNKTFAMIVVVIDTMYNKITMYYHSLNAYSEFTFEQIRKNSKSEAVDLSSLMKSFANGMAPKF